MLCEVYLLLMSRNAVFSCVVIMFSVWTLIIKFALANLHWWLCDLLLKILTTVNNGMIRLFSSFSLWMLVENKALFSLEVLSFLSTSSTLVWIYILIDNPGHQHSTTSFVNFYRQLLPTTALPRSSFSGLDALGLDSSSIYLSFFLSWRSRIPLFYLPSWFFPKLSNLP